MASEVTIEAFSLLKIVLVLFIYEICPNHYSWWESIRSVKGSQVLHVLIDLGCMLNKIDQGCWEWRDQMKKV